MNNVQAIAQQIMIELDAAKAERGVNQHNSSYSYKHYSILRNGIVKVALATGVKLQLPTLFGPQELAIICDEGSSYGEAFAGFMQGLRTRTGEIQYGYKATMRSSDRWCYMPYWDVEKIIKNAAA